MASRPRWPSDFFFEISDAAAGKAMAEVPLTPEDISPARRYGPSCKKNGVQVVSPDGKPWWLSADLYYDDFTGKWLLALQPEQYRLMKRRIHGPHDTLGGLVL